MEKVMTRIRGIYRLLKAVLKLYTIDPIDITYDEVTKEVFPVVSKSGCSSVKLSLIRRYVEGYESHFPDIHQLDVEGLTGGKTSRHVFSDYGSYERFCAGKHLVLVIRQPVDRFISCYGDVLSGKNIMYRYPSKLDVLIKFSRKISLTRFLGIIYFIPDRLADRHFRTQSYYLSPGVIKRAKTVEVLTLEHYMKGVPPGRRVHLNAGVRAETAEHFARIKSSRLFLRRYRRDIQLYESLEDGRLTLK